MGRTPWMLALAALVFASAVVGSAGAAPHAATPARGADTLRAVDELAAGVLVEINAVRKGRRLVPLRLSPRLAAAAGAHSRAMLTAGTFSHSSPDGTSFSERVRRWYGSRGYRRWSVGENLLFSSPGIGPAGAVQMWLASPPHRKNLLAPEWREVGISAVHAAAAPGVFEGSETVVLTADFGVRR